MKRRSHRLPIADTPHDDWVDESWTVDCVCGVNFDDGEEMVNCDECGVWVHTRCSRYVKGEKSFACHKCKRKNERDDNEETEVAQLLVELPTKTLRMDDNHYSSSVASRTARELWTQIPVEERVHIQGIPGGDPSLFSGSSSVFAPQLWKSTGHVPKKFNFLYREFPCWDVDNSAQVKGSGEENGAHVDNANTGGAQFSLSEVNKSPTTLANSVAVKSPNEKDICEKVASPEQMKRFEGEEMEASLSRTTVTEEPQLKQSRITSTKRKKEDAGPSEDYNENKKARIIEVEGDSKKKAMLPSRTASTLSSDRKRLEFCEDRGLKAVKTNTHCNKTLDSRNSACADHLSVHSVGENNSNVDQKPEAANEHSLGREVLSSPRHAISDRGPKEDDDGYRVTLKVDNSSKVHDITASGDVSVKDEVVSHGLGSSNDNMGVGPDFQKSASIVEETAGFEVKANHNDQGSSGDTISSSSDPNAGGKAECDENLVILDVQRVYANNSSRNVKVNNAAISTLDTVDRKVHDMHGRGEGGDDKKDASVCYYQSMPETTGSEGSLDSRKASSGHKHRTKASEDKHRVGDITSSSDLNQRKVVVCVRKSSSMSSGSTISKSSTSGSRLSSKVQIQSNDRQRGMSESNPGSRKESTSFEVVRDEERSGRSKKISKEVAKSSFSSSSKVLQATKFSNTTVHKRSSSDSNDSTLHSYSKASKAGATVASGKSASLLRTDGASNAQIKVSDAGVSHKGEKSNSPGAQLSSKGNTQQMQPPVSSNATLSDEEYALLLHQQLNSSPRVPRVPRMRHAGSVPQLTSPTAASMLLKRTSSSGGKDYSSTNRRKSKDSIKDGLHGSRDVNDEAKKMDRITADTES